MSANTLIISDDVYQQLFVKKPIFTAIIEKYLNNISYIQLKGQQHDK